MDVGYINPFIASTKNVFETMLNCELKRCGLSLKSDDQPSHDVTAVIGLSGKVNGSVVFSLSREVALKIVEQILGVEMSEVNAEVADAVGEVTNMIAGGAKAGLSQYELSLGLPNVIIGRNHTILFPGNISPICVLFESPWGPIVLEVGLDLRSAEPAGSVQKTEAELEACTASA